MKLSYAITVKDELVEITNLLNHLLANKRKEDEIVVLYDSKNGSKSVDQYLRAQNVEKTKFLWYPYEFDGHFANMKNHLTKLCSGDYIYQIDADEMISEYVMNMLPQVLEMNDVDIVRVPRINTVKGITHEHINKWQWNVNDKGWINFPDYQWRIYRNNNHIRWQNKVHESLIGYESIAHLPVDEEWCLIHNKDIKRQEQQNAYYDML